MKYQRQGSYEEKKGFLVHCFGGSGSRSGDSIGKGSNLGGSPCQNKCSHHKPKRRERERMRHTHTHIHTHTHTHTERERERERERY
jgi:hypothetical protein